MCIAISSIGKDELRELAVKVGGGYPRELVGDLPAVAMESKVARTMRIGLVIDCPARGHRSDDRDAP
jgi:hypothetical protein